MSIYNKRCWKEEEAPYIKFTLDNLDKITYPNIKNESLGLIAKNEIRRFLLLNYSYYTDQIQFETELIPLMNESCVELANILNVKFEEVNERMTPKKITKQREFTQNYGNEITNNSYYEPVKNGIQAITKITSQQTDWEPDITTESVTEDTTLTDSLALKELYDSIPYLISRYFQEYINTLIVDY